MADTRSLSLLLVCIILTSPAIATDPCCRNNEHNAASATFGFPSFIGQPFRGRGHVTASIHVVSNQAFSSNNKRLAINSKMVPINSRCRLLR